MAIASLHTEWLFHLKRLGLFEGRTSLLDLGPQDVQVTRAWLDAAMLRHEGSRHVERIDAICAGDAPRRDCQREFYGLFGISHYESADLDDDRADYRWDLNDPPSDLPKFDVVTDFGTIEHVYDLAAAMGAIHRLLKPGGLALHVVPVFAYPNHGFHTPNPNYFVEFARANGYAVADFSYVDNMFVRDQLQATRLGERFDFGSLPIKLRDMEDTRLFINKVVARFHANFLAPETREVMCSRAPHLSPSEYPSEGFDLCYVFDLQFVALVKPDEERPVVTPIQRYLAGIPPLPPGSAPVEESPPIAPAPEELPMAPAPPLAKPSLVTLADVAEPATERESKQQAWAPRLLRRLMSGRGRS
jgi:SAM-dependent methyltransferase